MSPRMPYHDGSMENGAREMIRRPCGPRKTTANQTNTRNPANLSARLKILQVRPRDSPAETSGEMEQKAAMAERYIKTHHQSPAQRKGNGHSHNEKKSRKDQVHKSHSTDSMVTIAEMNHRVWHNFSRAG